jgi:hypothetical protein
MTISALQQWITCNSNVRTWDTCLRNGRDRSNYRVTDGTKVNLSLSLIKHNAMNTYGGIEV